MITHADVGTVNIAALVEEGILNYCIHIVTMVDSYSTVEYCDSALPKLH